jgi:hypothetical protein
MKVKFPLKIVFKGEVCIYDVNICLETLLSICGKDRSSFFQKKGITCIICDSSEKGMQLTCGCSVCSTDCFEKVMKAFLSKLILTSDYKICYCGFSIDNIDTLKSYYDTVCKFHTHCFFCLKENEQSHILNLKEKIKVYNRFESFKHVICLKCLVLYLTE